MTIGDGIFYSALLLSFVGLYIATRDRWNWRKIVFRLLGGIIGMLVIGGSALYLNDIYERQPRKENSFWGIQLGISKGDVRFLKGKPFYHGIDEDFWIYRADSRGKKSFYVVSFEGEKVDLVMFDGPALDAPSIQGISGYSDLDTIKERFGEPTLIARSEDDTERILSYAQYNLAFHLRKNEITALGIFDGARRSGIQCEAK